jgi:hypothetical protein
MGKIAPFMERNGYRDACGWWVRDERCADQDVAGGICPECGSDLEGLVEGSSMGSRCPACGWSVVTTFALPILEDEREYTIILMPGGAPTREALKAISRIAMRNSVTAKQLMEGAPATLFSGRAAEVLERKNELEDAGVLIEVRPDFPYDRDGHLESEIRLNELLLAEFPELKGKFEDYTSWQDGMETGCFLTYEDLLLPRIHKAFRDRDERFLKMAWRFVEYLLTMGDAYAENVATVGILEGVKTAEDARVVRAYLGPTSLEVFDDPTLQACHIIGACPKLVVA